MKQDFLTVRSVLYDYFNHHIDMPRDEGYLELMKAIKYGQINVDDIRNELCLLLKSNVDWRKFGIELSLVPDLPIYTNEFVRNYVLFCIHDVAWPEKVITMEEREKLVVFTFNILKKYSSENKDWLFYDELFNELTSIDEFEELEFFNLNHVFYDGRGVFTTRIVRRENESLIQIGIQEGFIDHDIYDLRDPNEPRGFLI